MLFVCSVVLLAFVATVQSCNMACQMNYLPVCGTDGVTYGNLCQLNAHACSAKTTVVAAYEGACQTAAVCKTACQFAYNPVCGTDGVTYGNRCQLESTACLQKTGVVVAHVGECARARLAPVSDCKVACQRNYEPVCGTDGSTFSNLCQLESFACTKRLNLLVAHLGAC